MNGYSSSVSSSSGLPTASTSSSSSTSTSTSTKERKMLIKFESKSNRVKGLAFHSTRPWILSSLHNGSIQLWDYRMEVLLDTYDEHDGPVRGVSFHSTQPLFVSGGDDYKIKVWNYQQKKCLYSLLGHLDYIRTVEFHSTHPWIVSASDDQTIRIWNWMSRQCISVLTGHNHYVMCAQFHPTEDLLLSASLDQTVRVWDITGLRKKHVTIGGDLPSSINRDRVTGDNSGADLFGTSDCVVKHVLEGHTRGVNWASFHRNLSLVVSGADDREVKLWRMTESKAWEVDTMRGHTNNVSCVQFHPKREMIISNSEDRTIRVWDITKQQQPLCIRRESDRYWILAVHPTLNLLAAGHDSGLLVFKLHRERPSADSFDGKVIYYFKEQYLYEYNIKSSKESTIMSTRRRGIGYNLFFKHLYYNHYNKEQHCMLFTTEGDTSYELFVINKSATSDATESLSGIRGQAKAVVWVGRKQFAVLDKTRKIILRTLDNTDKRVVQLPNIHINYIFSGGASGRLIVRTSDTCILYDLQNMKIIHELPTQSRHPIKYCIWKRDGHYCALFSKASIIVTDNKLNELCSINESTRIKSGAWDLLGVFVYATSTHLKYVLPNGEHGIIRTLDAPIYIQAVNERDVVYMDRDNKVGKFTIDTTEYQFKIALHRHRHTEVLKIMQSKKLTGQSIISYLHQKGYPEVALHFVDDLDVKFNLALECGNITVATECAEQLDTQQCWQKLGVEALRQGNHKVVEAALQKTKNFERLSFLYLITGNTDKLSKMLHIASLRNDVQGRYHNALYLGNVQERITVLREIGQVKLAFITAYLHGCEELVNELHSELGDDVPDISELDMNHAKLLQPCQPILRHHNWPLLQVKKGFFDQLGEDTADDNYVEEKTQFVESDKEDDTQQKTDDFGWGSTAAAAASTAPDTKSTSKNAGITSGAGWGDELEIAGIDLNTVNDTQIDTDTNDSEYFVMPINGKPFYDQWTTSNIPADLISAGSFDLAMHMLNRQLGIVNFKPLQSLFVNIHHCVRPTVTFVTNTTINVPVYKQQPTTDAFRPQLPYTINTVQSALTTAYNSFAAGQFQQALNEFVNVLHIISLILNDSTELADAVSICREYITATRLVLARNAELGKGSSTDVVRQLSLAVYLAECKLQPAHAVLGVRTAMTAAAKADSFKLAAVFARRALELANSNSAASQAVPRDQVTKFLKIFEQKNTDQHQIDYDSNNFQLCCTSLTPIPNNVVPKTCPFDQSKYKSQYNNQLCATCEIAQIGLNRGNTM